MSVNINVFTCDGNLTRDPEFITTPSGVSILKFSIAVNDRVKKNNEWVDEASYFDVVTFGKNAENGSKFLIKGKSVGIVGKLKQESWVDQQTGQKRSKVKIIANQIRYLFSIANGNNYITDSNSQNGNDEDIPF